MIHNMNIPTPEIHAQIREFARRANTIPGYLGLRQCASETFNIPLDVQEVKVTRGEKTVKAWEMIGLRLNGSGQWQSPIIEGGQVVGYENVNIDQAVLFALPYLAKHNAILSEC